MTACGLDFGTSNSAIGVLSAGMRAEVIWLSGAARAVRLGWRRIVATPRIGIYNSGEWQERPLRFCWDSPHLARPIPKAAKG